MIKKLLLATLFILQLSILPSWGADTVLIDRLTSSEAEELNIEIPADVPPGYHEVVIEISDDAGIVDQKILTFCKDIDGRIDWASECPQLVKIYSESELAPISERVNLPVYNPAQEPEKTKDLQVTAFAALAALSAAGASAAANKNSEDKSDEEEGQEDESGEESDDLSSVSAGKLKKVERQPGWGDLSSTWKSPLTAVSDSFFAGIVTRISPYSPIVARTFADGNYLRAMLGSLAALILVPGAIFGALAVKSSGGQALPPATWIVAAIIAIATLDAMAGFLAGAIFALGVIASGNFASRDEILTVAGLFIIFYAPALMASAVRPLRRLADNRDNSWERVTDYALVTLLSGWTMSKLIGGLNALAGVQLVISFHAKEIAYLTSVMILVRMLLEDLATYKYPMRLNATIGEFREQTVVHKIISLELKLFIFVELAMPFVGYNIKLLLGTLIFLAPSVIDLTIGDKLPQFRILHRLLPAGAFKLVAMVFIGAITAGWIQGMFTNPQTFIEWSFVVLAIPGLILALLNKMAAEPEKDWKVSPRGNTLYRVIGIITFLLIIQIVRGVDLYAAVFG